MSKTVKRVSKTAKRVMTVMMIGLVAMLGANAEAHTRWFKGRPFVCSICSDAKDTELREVLEDPRSIFAVAELVVKTQKARILCPDKTEGTSLVS